MTDELIEQVKCDREAGTPGPWVVEYYACKADADDVEYWANKAPKKERKKLKVGDTLWRRAVSIGPVSVDHDHWAGWHITADEYDVSRIARVPEMEARILSDDEEITRLRAELSAAREAYAQSHETRIAVQRTEWSEDGKIHNTYWEDV